MLMKIEKERIEIYITTIVVSILNVLFYDNAAISYGLAILETFFLLFQWIQKKFAKYLSYYIIFISTSMEFSSFLSESELYSLKNIRILGLNMGIWLFIPLLVSFFLTIYKIGYVKVKYFTFWKASKILILMNIVAGIIGFLGILFNDNNIQALDGYLGAYIDSAYSLLFLPFALIISFYVVIMHDERKLWMIENTLQAVLWGCVFQMLTSIIFDKVGKYGSTDTVLVSVVYVFIPFLFLLSFYKRTQYKTANFVLGIAGLLIVLKDGASGKIFLTCGCALGVFFYISFVNKEKRMRIILTILLFCIVVTIPIVMNRFIRDGSDLFNYKLYEVKQLLSVSKWNMNFFRNMENSPRVRIGEMLNVFLEYYHKPWNIFTGKGYAGTIMDHSGILELTPEYARSGAFSNEEYSNGIFYNLHEITTVLLTFGMNGIYCIMFIIKKMITNIETNFWMLIGAFWFVIYYGYSFTIATFGMTTFCYGFLLCNLKDDYIGV